MDKSIYVALNAMQTLKTDMRINAQNLANVNVPGFRADTQISRGSTFLEAAEQLSTRVFQRQTNETSFSENSGTLTNTDQPLDLSIVGKGYFYVKTENEEVGLSRRGDMQLNTERILVNGAGQRVLNDSLQPINVPPYEDIVINELGEIFIKPAGSDEAERIQVGTIGSIANPNVSLIKSASGIIKPSGDTDLPKPNQTAKIGQGQLETSNVSSIGELINSLENQRKIEMVTKFIKTAKEIDESGTRLLRMPGS